jgi:hypothetical protein
MFSEQDGKVKKFFFKFFILFIFYQRHQPSRLPSALLLLLLRFHSLYVKEMSRHIFTQIIPLILSPSHQHHREHTIVVIVSK